MCSVHERGEVLCEREVNLKCLFIPRVRDVFHECTVFCERGISTVSYVCVSGVISTDERETAAG